MVVHTRKAELLTMTEFQMLLAAKYPEQKGFTRDEYDAVADDYMAKKARRLGAGATGDTLCSLAQP